MTQDFFQKIENPYITGNPIKSKELFFGRQDEFIFIKNNIGKTKVILLKGGRRSGKTSILKQIESGHISEIREVAEAVFCDFHRMSQIEQDDDLPRLIGNAILAVSTFHDLRDSFMNDNGSWTVKLVRLIRACLKKISPKVLILLWDEYEESLERPLNSKKISASEAFRWFTDVKDEKVYFIMTGSKEFGGCLQPILSSVYQPLDITLLTENDTNDLIRKPVEGFLKYSDGAVQRIYRISGGYPFFVQYLCQLLVDHINLKLHRNYAEADDLDGVIDFIMDNTHGHVVATWSGLKDQAKMTLAALAHTIRESDAYTKPAEVIRTARKLGFPMGEKEYNETISAVKNIYLIHRQDDRVRFRIDIFRYWIKYNFRTFEDLKLENDYPPYTDDDDKKPLYRKILLYVGAAIVLAGMLFGGYKFFSKPKLKTGDCVILKEGVTEPCEASDVKKEKKEYITSRKQCKIVGLKGDKGIVQCPPSNPDITDFDICLKEWKKVECK